MIKKVFLIAMLASFALMFAKGANAHQEVNFFTPTETVKYILHQYPSKDSYFYLPYKYKSEFTITNGKFFEIANNDFLGTRKVNLDVYFYFPGENGKADKFINKVRVRSSNTTYSVPHRAYTLGASNLKVRIVNRDRDNRDIKFYIYTPNNPVLGVPVHKSSHYGEIPEEGYIIKEK